MIVLAPIEPADTGNGLAMRTSLFCRGCPTGAELRVVVVPVAGEIHAAARAEKQSVAVVKPDAELARAGIRSLLTDVAWRERLAAAGSLPSLARAASPGLADVVAAACGDAPAGVHVMRSYLAPLGLAIAERLDCRWLSLDLDDDDAALARRLGQDAEASAYDRAIAVFAPSFDALCAASASEAQAMSARYGVDVEHIPNAIDLPVPPARPEAGAQAGARMLFVGNLTYPPNADAARILAEDILPLVRERVDGAARARLVGTHNDELARLAGDGVELTGFVGDLGGVYAEADVVVAPLVAGGGTRLKLLEAFAREVPVVASRAAADGLLAEHGEHLLLADRPDEFAAAIARLASDPGLREVLVANARRLVESRYDTRVVEPQIRAFFDRAASRARGRQQPAASP